MQTLKYIYCLVRNTEIGPEAFPRGLDGAEIHHASFSGVGALISSLDHAHLVSSVQSILDHQAVVVASLKLFRSIIPCRFGTLFSDEESILTFLKEHYLCIDAQLTRLEGKIEVSVHAIFNGKMDDEETGSFPLSGIDYLLRKKEKFDAIRVLEEEADRFNRDLNKALSPLWSEVKVQRVPGVSSPGEKKLLNSICYLVEQQKLLDFKNVYQRFKSDKPSLRLLYTGPWPPYSFADIDLHAGKE